MRNPKVFDKNVLRYFCREFVLRSIFVVCIHEGSNSERQLKRENAKTFSRWEKIRKKKENVYAIETLNLSPEWFTVVNILLSRKVEWIMGAPGEYISEKYFLFGWPKESPFKLAEENYLHLSQFAFRCGRFSFRCLFGPS